MRRFDAPHNVFLHELKNMIMITRTDTLQKFRTGLYSLFPKRKDAIINLLDAISGHAHKTRSVVALSEAPCFERQYTSITDAIADGLPHADWEGLQRYQYQQLVESNNNQPLCFILDCTANPRQFSKKLSDRTITHAPNPAPGNKPICVGHQYSCAALLPNRTLEGNGTWLIPLSMQRVSSDQKGNEVGMEQISDIMKLLNLNEKTVVSIGDSLYGSQACRVSASQHDNLVHIFRLNVKRNIFFPPTPDVTDSQSKGRKKEYGDKMSLSDPTTHSTPSRQASTTYRSTSNNEYSVKIDAWDNMLLRGSRNYRGSKHPITVIRIQMLDQAGKLIFKRPLWIALTGKRRSQVNLIEVYRYYKSRYNIEHLFRFAKYNLLLTDYQTSDTEHEVLWLQLCMLAYNQLYAAQSLVKRVIKKWEKYLPENKKPVDPSTPESHAFATPSQSQRGFSELLEVVGTPGAPCVQRGKNSGREPGQAGFPKPNAPIIFKQAKKHSPAVECDEKTATKAILSGSGKTASDPNPQKIESLIEFVCSRLPNFSLTPAQFGQMLQDSG